MLSLEQAYLQLTARGAQPQEARSILPNSLKTEIVVTMNLREWRHFFRLRTSEKAHPQMREVAAMALREMQHKIPVIFDDIQNA
ncbi:MAG: FAD-dependent thymidylate synthase [Lachnospiraceae bacterium]|nr:FAD-dependent thymidylate synthase [Lachnospiraceae bacterium]